MYNSSAELGIYRKPACVLLAAGVFSAAGTFAINHWRYQTFRVAGPFDLAYFNQQQWNLWHGMASLTIRPRISYATEGPEPWRTMRLRPITLLVTLLYPLAPGVPLLLAIQSISIGLGVLPAYLLGRHVASGQRAAGLLAAAAYALAPPVWVLGTNDFRYFYLGLPVLFCLYFSLKAGSRRGTAFWSLALLSVRSPYCIVLALLGFSILFGRDRMADRLKWCLALFALAVFWLFITVAYLYLLFGPTAAAGYVEAMIDPIRYYGRNPGAELAALKREWPRLALVLAPACLVAWAVPELFVVALLLFYPPLRMGLFTLHPAQQYVRFLAPALAVLLLAMVTGLARLSSWTRAYQSRHCLAAATLAAMAAASVLYIVEIFRLPSRVDTRDAAALKEAMRKIQYSDAVLAYRDILPNLSCRTVLYDYYQLPEDTSLESAAGTIDWAVIERRQSALIEYLNRTGRFRREAEFRTVFLFSKKSHNAEPGLKDRLRASPPSGQEACTFETVATRQILLPRDETGPTAAGLQWAGKYDMP